MQSINAHATLAVHQSDFEIPFGVVKTEGIDLIEFREKPVLKHIVNAGVYVISPKLLKNLKKNQMIDMPDILMAGLGIITESLFVQFMSIGLILVFLKN